MPDASHAQPEPTTRSAEDLTPFVSCAIGLYLESIGFAACHDLLADMATASDADIAPFMDCVAGISIGGLGYLGCLDLIQRWDER